MTIEGWWMSDRESFTLQKERSPLFVKMGSKLDERSFITSQQRLEANMSYTAEEKYLHLME